MFFSKDFGANFSVGWMDYRKKKLTQKLQSRFSGPYRITKRISPVVYHLLVDGVEKVVHAINMKPFKGAKNILTQCIEPGLEKEEAPIGIA